MAATTLTSKGQITIPKAVRDALHIQVGDKVEFFTNEANEIVLKPVTRKVSDLKGALSRYKKEEPVTVEEMKQAMKDKFSNK